MKTQTVIEYGAVDLTAKQDSNFSAPDRQPFGKFINLKRPSLPEVKYGTLEKNFFVLDGNITNMGSTISDVGWWSYSMSDEDGNFSTPPTMTITFSQPHSSLGLTLTFSQYSYCNSLKIQYYDASNTLLSENTFEPDNYDYFCEDTVANYRKIIITFYSTNLPYRYVKLYRILYGKAVLFDGDSLISANLLEQVNLLSDEITINTLDFVVYSQDDKFNILNPQGVYATLQQNQQLNVYKVTEDETTSMGTFYIDNWQSKNDNKMEFRGIDIVGLLDKTTYDGGMYTNILSQNLIADIMQSAGYDNSYYSIESSLQNISLTGYIPVCTHREALQQVLFTIGGVANCARTDIINIEKATETQEPNVINKSNVFKGTKEIEQMQTITGVLIKAHNYSQGSESKKIYEKQLTAGTYKITTRTPSYNYTCTGATIQSYNANYVVINVANSGNVVINGYEYIDNTQDVLIPNPDLNGSEKPNVLNIESVFLINNSNVQSVGERVLEYYSRTYKTKFKFVVDDEKAGDNIISQESYDNELNGYVTELDIDLTGGYVTKAEIVAKVSDE